MMTRFFTRKYLPKIILVLLLAAFLVPEKYPGIFFKYRLQYKNFVIHSSEDMPDSTIIDIDMAINLLSKSPIYNNKFIYEVYVSNAALPYLLIGPDFSSGSFARTNIFNNISIRRCDFERHTCYSNSKTYNARPLSALIAHEATHINMRQSIGFVKEFLLDRWVKEGLADYVARGSSFTDENAHKMYLEGAKIDSKSFDYYVYRMVVAYAIEKKGLSFQQLLTQEHDIDSLRNYERKLSQK